MSAPRQSLDRADRLALAASVLLAVGAYASSLGHAFVYDDLHVIVENPLLHSLAEWRAILTTGYWGPELYRPITSLSFAVDWWLSGGRPMLFHAENVVLHGAVTALVFLLVRCYLPTFGAAVASLLFAVHPVHVEAVASVVGRGELLAAGFVLAGVLTYRADGVLAARGDETWRRAATSLGSLALLAFGLGSKEMAFATPGLLLLTDWMEAKRVGERPRDRFARHWILWVATVALTAEYLWVRSFVVGGLAGVHPGPGLEGEGVVGRMLIMAPVVLQYVRLLLFPVRLAADYAPDFLRPRSELTPEGIAGFVVVLLLIAVAVRARARAPLVTYGLMWLGGTLLVVANILVPTGVLLAERSLYLPSVGPVLLAGWVANRLAQRRRALTAVAVAVIAGLMVLRTTTRVEVWRSPAEFLVQLVSDAPNSFRGYWVVSIVAYGEGDAELGEAMALRALAIRPRFPNLWQFVAQQYAQHGRWMDAGHAYRSEFELDSTRIRAAAEAVVNYVRAGALDSAVAVGERAQRVDPHDYRLHIALGDLALAQNRPFEAMTRRRRVAWQLPAVWQYWYLTAEAALAARYCPEVARDLQRLRALGVADSVTAPLRRGAGEVGC